MGWDFENLWTWIIYFPGASQVALVVKNLPANVGDTGWIPGSRRSTWGGHGQYSCLENPCTEETEHTLAMNFPCERDMDHQWDAKGQIREDLKASPMIPTSLCSYPLIIPYSSLEYGASLVAQIVKNTIPWKREWKPTQVFLHGEFHDRGTWWATVHGVTKNQTRLSN